MNLAIKICVADNVIKTIRDPKQDLIDKIDSIDVYITTPLNELAASNGKLISITEENGKLVARQKPLKVGEIVGNDYVVLDGIKSGDKAVVSGTQFLVDGAQVTPQG